MRSKLYLFCKIFEIYKDSSLWKQFLQYCQTFGDTALQSVKQCSKDTPGYIICWIMETCESEGLKLKSSSLNNTEDEVLEAKGHTYSHALKMRAAVSWGFAYKQGVGSNEPWIKTKSGEYQGNPSISHEVGRYMVSLNRRKVNSAIA